MGMLQAFLESNIVNMPEDKLIQAIHFAGNEVLSWIGEDDGAVKDVVPLTSLQAGPAGDTPATNVHEAS